MKKKFCWNWPAKKHSRHFLWLFVQSDFHNKNVSNPLTVIVTVLICRIQQWSYQLFRRISATTYLPFYCYGYHLCLAFVSFCYQQGWKWKEKSLWLKIETSHYVEWDWIQLQNCIRYYCLLRKSSGSEKKKRDLSSEAYN